MVWASATSRGPSRVDGGDCVPTEPADDRDSDGLSFAQTERPQRRRRRRRGIYVMLSASPQADAEISMLYTPRHGRHIDDFLPGAVYAHPWDVTVDDGMLALFAASFQDATPTYASRAAARALGLRDRPAHP